MHKRKRDEKEVLNSKNTKKSKVERTSISNKIVYSSEEEADEYLAKQISLYDYSFVESLDFSQRYVGKKTALALAKANLSSLISLNLGFNNLGSEGLKILFTAYLPNLTNLNLTGSNLGKTASSFFAQLNSLSNLTTLILKFNDLGIAEEKFALAELNLPNLTFLDLSLNNLGFSQITALEKANLPQLTSLDLLFSKPDENGQIAQALVKLLTNNPNIKNLKIDNYYKDYIMNEVLKHDLEKLQNADISPMDKYYITQRFKDGFLKELVESIQKTEENTETYFVQDTQVNEVETLLTGVIEQYDELSEDI